MKHTQIHLLVVVVCSMLFVGCSETLEVMPSVPTDIATAGTEIGFGISETAWEGKTVMVTRSGETLSGLKETLGFGVYSKRLGLQNRQVTWDEKNGRWNYGSKMLWPENRVKYSVSFNGVDEQSTDRYFKFTGNHSFNTKFKDCIYKGITFTSGLELEEGGGNPTTISWECGDGTVVIIVQSTSDESTKDNKFKFDDQELEIDGSTELNEEEGGRVPVYSVEEIDGGRVYTIRNVGAGEHNITRGGSETGILYVSTEAEILAYAPYSEKNGGRPYDTPNSEEWLKEGKSITFSVDKSIDKGTQDVNPWYNIDTDLLWASSVIDDNGIVNLDFKHALAKLSFGTIVNNYGADIKMTKVSVTGKQNLDAYLSLVDGKWTSIESGSAEATCTFTTFGEKSSLEIENGDADLFNIGDMLLIPNEDGCVDVKVTIDLEDDENKNFNVEKNVRLQQGKNMEINLTVGRNHEVVIQ